MFLLATASAQAFKTNQPPYHYRGNPARITYWNATAYGWGVDKAVKAWNRSGAHLHFAKAASRSAAKVVIQYLPGPANDFGICLLPGYGGSTGSNGALTKGSAWVQRTKDPTPWRCRFESAIVIAHELGHVIGLQHETSKCALMNPEYVNRSPQHCPPNQPDQWRCRLIERDDARGAVSLYGGTPNPPKTPAFCPAPLAPNGFNSRASTAAGQATVVDLSGDDRSLGPAP